MIKVPREETLVAEKVAEAERRRTSATSGWGKKDRAQSVVQKNNRKTAGKETFKLDIACVCVFLSCFSAFV